MPPTPRSLPRWPMKKYSFAQREKRSYMPGPCALQTFCRTRWKWRVSSTNSRQGVRSVPPPNQETSPASRYRTFRCTTGTNGFRGWRTRETPVAKKGLPASSWALGGRIPSFASSSREGEGEGEGEDEGGFEGDGNG